MQRHGTCENTLQVGLTCSRTRRGFAKNSLKTLSYLVCRAATLEKCQNVLNFG